MKKLTVGDIMTQKVITAKATDAIVTVARLLQKKKIHGLPIVNSNKEVVGIITEADFYLKNELGFHIPTYIEFVRKAEFAKANKASKSPEYSALMSATAADIMTADCLVVESTLSLPDIINFFQEKKLYTVPVVDKKKILVGIVTVADIIKLI